MCLLVLRMLIACQMTGREYGSRSLACGDGQMASTSDRASPSFTNVARSADVPSLRTPVRSSYT